ncbi:MAG: hypothetical protein ABI068_09015 [Ktedonobacterales bacterium]
MQKLPTGDMNGTTTRWNESRVPVVRELREQAMQVRWVVVMAIRAQSLHLSDGTHGLTWGVLRWLA